MRTSQVNIVLVEDHPGDARLVKEMLVDAHKLRHELTHLTTLQQARDYLTIHVPDVVLLDLTLPDSHGLKSASELMEAFPTIPFIILTGLDDEVIGLESVRRGAQDYLVKGQIDGKLIIRVILYSIERKQAAMEREKLIKDMQELFAQVKTLKGLLPMCAWCKKIRDDKGEWVVLESYILNHSNTEITHGICPECIAAHHGKL
jgi:DNA-binding response OmpR family regulator